MEMNDTRRDTVELFARYGLVKASELTFVWVVQAPASLGGGQPLPPCL